MQENKKTKKITQLCRRPAVGKAGPFLLAQPSFADGQPSTKPFLCKKNQKKEKRSFADGLPC
jgi:hypothetical protein